MKIVNCEYAKEQELFCFMHKEAFSFTLRQAKFIQYANKTLYYFAKTFSFKFHRSESNAIEEKAKRKKLLLHICASDACSSRNCLRHFWFESLIDIMEERKHKL